MLVDPSKASCTFKTEQRPLPLCIAEFLVYNKLQLQTLSELAIPYSWKSEDTYIGYFTIALKINCLKFYCSTLMYNDSPVDS